MKKMKGVCFAEDEALSSPLDLGEESVRQRLGPAAWKAFWRIMHIWKVSGEDARQLLALPSGMNSDGMDTAQLSEEQLVRISCVLGIYRALHFLHRTKLADGWIKLPNTNAIFGGQTPLAFMRCGGIGALQNVRRLLDARCEGA